MNANLCIWRAKKKRYAHENRVIIILEKLFLHSIPTSVPLRLCSLSPLALARQFVSAISIFFLFAFVFLCDSLDCYYSSCCHLPHFIFQFTFSQWIKIYSLPLHRILSCFRHRRRRYTDFFSLVYSFVVFFFFFFCAPICQMASVLCVRQWASPLWPTWRQDAAAMPRKLHFHVSRSSNDNNNEIFVWSTYSEISFCI